MDETRLARIMLLALQALIGVTAVAGGAALIAGALDPGLATVLSPPLDHLDGSPFSSYLAPGVLLAVVLGGVHLVAFALLLRRHRWAHLVAAVAAFDVLIWIFVQVMIIPFSILQVAYFAAGLAEVGFLLLLLGLARPAGPAPRNLGGDRAATPAPGRSVHV